MINGFQRKKHRKYTKLVLLSGVPILVVLCSLLLTNYFYFCHQNENAQTFYREMLRCMAMGDEEKIQSVIGGVQFLVKENSMVQLMNSDEFEQSDVLRFKKISDDFISSYKLVDSMFVFNPDAEMALNADGTAKMVNFFQNKSCYENYPSYYWKNLYFFESGPYRILSPTILSDGNGENRVIPIVCRKAGDNRAKNFLVVNLDFDHLLGNLIKEKYFDDSSICVLNRYTGQVFCNSDIFENENIMETELYNELIGGKNEFDCEIENLGNCFIVAYSTSDKLLGYTYFSIVPHRTLLQTQLPVVIMSVIIGAAFFLLACITSLRGTKKMMMPIDRLICSAEKTEGETQGILEMAETQVDSLLKKKSELERVQPFVRVSYLINYLNSTDIYINAEDKKTILKSLSFRYNYFSVVILQMYPTDEFYDTYTNEGYVNIRRGLYQVVKDLFSERFETMVLSTDKESLCIVLNADEESEAMRDEIIVNYLGLCKNDMDYIDLFLGVGGFYIDLEGMKESYQEAISSIKLIPKPKLNISFDNRVYKNAFMLSNRDENQLFNDLVTGDLAAATQRINALANDAEGKNEKQKKQLYTRILNVVLRVMNIKGLDYEGKMEYEVYHEVLENNSDSMYRKILILLDQFPEKMERKTSKYDCDRIIEYINANYQNTELSREMIADIFNTQPNYLSSLIKNQLGINFKDYLTNIRIAKAKELLLKEDKNIQDIYEKVGFGSKQTFYRTFKNVVGITPNEYRKKEAEDTTNEK